MKLILSLIHYLFFYFFFNFIKCDKLSLENKFHFNDVKPPLKAMGPNSSVLYPLIQDLEEEEKIYSENLDIYDETNFPNPFESPEKCVLSLGISHTWICDPSNIIKLEDQLNIEAALLKIRDTNYHSCLSNENFYYQVAVAIVPDIFIRKNNSIEKSIQEFSQNILRKWGIGNKKCHDGILFVYIKRLGSFIVSKREGVEDKYINETEIKNIFMNSYFATGSISKALISSLNFINKKLPSKPQGSQCEK
ncbi:MOLO1 domain-containing protein [Plasmodium yoelii yoelii]|uniref:MOLO1 domain-containing protein n=1 Tax=Plasmodium yoelii yoelii TaxID=73239 RepID=A0AAE9WR68_PLAYO|nr:MOLO1 domain-containing protein [Plasmodium yoelii yoelii]